MPDDTADKIHDIGLRRILNPRMVRDQGLDAARAERLQDLHAEMQGLMLRYADAGPDLVPVLNAEVRRVEYAMQAAWGFEPDASRHSHWWTVPGCRCPKDVNGALFGQAARFVSDECRIHSATEIVPGVTLMTYVEAREPKRS